MRQTAGATQPLEIMRFDLNLILSTSGMQREWEDFMVPKIPGSSPYPGNQYIGLKEPSRVGKSDASSRTADYASLRWQPMMRFVSALDMRRKRLEKCDA
jgi:hypothetical protein